MNIILEVKNVSFARDNIAIFKQLNFTVNQGDFLCIVGTNGSGKSTLLKLILGLLQPTSGQIIKNDAKLGYLPQETVIAPDFPATVSELVQTGAIKNKSRLEYALKSLDIKKLAAKPLNSLSGGQRQKALLARALAAAEDILVLDEPSNNLDQKSKKKLYQDLEHLNQAGLTIIMVTHDLDHGNLIGNKILALTDKPFFGSTTEYIRRVHKHA